MTQPLLSSRVDRLLRSLVGVADVHLTFGTDGKLRSVAILRDGNMPEHQLVRNVLSGLKAGFGVRLDPESVQVALSETAWPHRALQEEPASADTDVAPMTPVREAAPNRVAAYANGNGQHANGNGAAKATTNGAAHGNGNGNGNGNGRQHAAVVQEAPVERDTMTLSPAPARESGGVQPQLELIDVERHGVTLRCRVSLRVGERTYSAIAEVRDAPSAEAELAARVTLDALRAGGFTAARLDGVSLTTIGEMVYVVAAVRTAATSAPRGGAAPLLRSMASAAAAAVLNAHGPIGLDEPRAARTGTA